MLPTPSSPVKPAWHHMLKEQAIIWGSLGGLALLLYVTGWDAALSRTLAHATSTPFTGTAFTKFMREYGSLPAALLSLAGLVALFWPRLWQKRPTLYQTAAVMVLTTVFGVGLINQILVKNLADRPRPRESILTDAPAFMQDGFRGNSMPSGHAAMGFVLAAPFFPLRRRRPRLAAAVLATGLAAGTVIGLSRIMLGAHFPTDVLMAGAICLSTAAALTPLFQRIRRIPHTTLALGTLACALCVVLGNRFSNLTLIYAVQEPFRAIALPCTPVATSVPGTTVPTLTVRLHGYGAPLSQLQLTEKDKTITLQRAHGLYHHLTCTAQLALPPEE